MSTPSYPTSAEFDAIASFYGDRCAERSGVPLINHIHEGVAIILALRCQLPNGRHFHNYGPVHAYCLHPLFQNDAELTTVGMRAMQTGDLGRLPVALAMEYRACANAWLSDKVRTVGSHMLCDGKPSAGPLPEVAAMLIADKVQNYKDFLQYHDGKHPRSVELSQYFQIWLGHLGVSDELFGDLCVVAEGAVK